MIYTAPLYYSILFYSQYLLHYMAPFKIAIENASTFQFVNIYPLIFQ